MASNWLTSVHPVGREALMTFIKVERHSQGSVKK